jgi:hypothetical protein
MSYFGTIIEESLADKSVLTQIKIIDSKIEPTTLDHKTPWIKQWTLDKVEIPDDQVDRVAQTCSKSIDPEHKACWYIDFRNETVHYVIFFNKVFRLDRKDPDAYEECMDFGKRLGIPAEQMEPVRKYWINNVD